MLQKPRVSVCMVLDRSGRRAEAAAASVMASDIPVEMYLADLTPGDLASRLVQEACPGAHHLPLPPGCSHSQAHNAVIPSLHNAYHVVMTPDVTVEPDLLRRMADLLDAHPDVVMLTPRLLDEAGRDVPVPRLQPRIRYLIAGPLCRHLGLCRKWRRRYVLADWQQDTPMSVQLAHGSMFMIRTKVFYRLEGFDRRFPLSCADADLSRRALKYGQILLHPEVCVTRTAGPDSASRAQSRAGHLLAVVRFLNKWGWVW